MSKRELLLVVSLIINKFSVGAVSKGFSSYLWFSSTTLAVAFVDSGCVCVCVCVCGGGGGGGGGDKFASSGTWSYER